MLDVKIPIFSPLLLLHDAQPWDHFPQDDIIDDVGDFVAAAEILKERGAYKIYIMATHGLLSADAPRLIEESAIDEVTSCVTVLSVQ